MNGSRVMKIFSKKFFACAAAIFFCAAIAFGAEEIVAGTASGTVSGDGDFDSLPAELGGDFSLGDLDPFEVEPLPERFLARKGRLLVKIFISANGATDDELSAAFDLAKWLRRVAGVSAEIPVETEALEPKSLASIPTGIYLGNTRAAAKLGIYAPAGEGETSLIETRGNAIFIVGKTPAATRIAAADFLRECVGINFVWPGDDGAEWPARDEIEFPRVRIENLPAFPWRLMLVGNDEWRVHLGFGAVPRFSHNLGAIFTPALYAEHPDLAPIVLGESREKISGLRAPQPNLANPSAVPVVVSFAREFFRKNPAAMTLSVGINDSTNWDESAESADAFGPLTYFRNLPNRSDYFYKFVNRTAAAFTAEASLAEKSVGVIAYLDVAAPPSFPLRTNIVPVLCADRSMWVFPEFKFEDKALMRRWAASGAETWGIYDYYYGSPFVFPRVFLDEEADAIKFVHENGGKIFFAECFPVIAFDAPKIWLASALLRDPDADPEKILDAYYEKTFGAAAPTMKRFYDCCGEIWKAQGGQTRWIKGWNNENVAEIYPPEKLSALRSLLNEAVAEQRNAVARAAGTLTEAQNIFAGTTAERSRDRKAAAVVAAAAAQMRLAEAETARNRRISARLAEVDDALSRAEKFSQSYFARKKLSAAPEDFSGTLAALFSPAWRSEEIFDPNAFTAHTGRADISKILLADPRPAALTRVLEFLKNSDASDDEKLRVDRALERVFGAAMNARTELIPAEKSAVSAKKTDRLAGAVPANDVASGTTATQAAAVAAESAAPSSEIDSEKARAAADARLELISEAIPFFDAEPSFRESFDAENFIAYAPGDWRVGKNLTRPRGWRAILSASEKLEFGASAVSPHGGNASLRIAGKAERAELVRSFRVAPGKKVLAQIFARGTVSCGAFSFFEIEFLDASGKRLARTGDALFVGRTGTWRRLVALGKAPAGTKRVKVRLYVGAQGEGDEMFFDDFSLTFF